ncbi:MAG: SpoIVB peptidase [Clostridia bacterium]|nr:SpoIVB peptidase [Clostridia bacterium]
MVKHLKRFLFISSLFLIVFSGNISFYIASADDSLIIGGFPVGVSLQTRGAYIIGISEVLTEKGYVSPAKDIDLKVGDVILSVNKEEVNNAYDIEKTVNSKDNYILEVKRDDTITYKTIKPALDINGKYRLGVYLRNEINGIGTATFIKNGKIAILGHPILDENNNIIEVKKGYIFNATITGYKKGERGKAGELNGNFTTELLSSEIKNTKTGVYGQLEKGAKLSSETKMAVGNATIDDAEILTTIDGNAPVRYKISILKTNFNNNDTNSMVIRITDKRLLSTTNGIVQGMSGSPIIQNEKIVGAVTHVFINDPTCGFGISIYDMLKDCE